MVVEFGSAVVSINVEGVLGQTRGRRLEELTAESENEAVVEKSLLSVRRVDDRGLPDEVEVGHFAFHARDAGGAKHAGACFVGAIGSASAPEIELNL
jgi:hypothetical protein